MKSEMLVYIKQDSVTEEVEFETFQAMDKDQEPRKQNSGNGTDQPEGAGWDTGEIRWNGDWIDTEKVF